MRSIFAIFAFLALALGTAHAQQPLPVEQIRVARAVLENMLSEGAKYRSSLKVCVDQKPDDAMIECVRSFLAKQKTAFDDMEKATDAFFDMFKPAKNFPRAALDPITNALAEIALWQDTMTDCLKRSSVKEQSSCITRNWNFHFYVMKEQELGAKIVSGILKELTE